MKKVNEEPNTLKQIGKEFELDPSEIDTTEATATINNWFKTFQERHDKMTKSSQLSTFRLWSVDN